MSDITDKILKQLEEYKLKSMINTKTKKERFATARKTGYSVEFAVIFATQK
jgi:hypothetical protein